MKTPLEMLKEMLKPGEIDIESISKHVLERWKKEHFLCHGADPFKECIECKEIQQLEKDLG